MTKEERYARLNSLIQQAESLFLATNILQTLVRSWPGLALSTTAVGEIVAASTAWKQVLGYDQEEMIKLEWVNLIHPDDLDGVMNEVARMPEDEECIDYCSRLISASGESVLLRWTATNYGLGPNFAIAEVVDDD